ncbi:MAG: MvaI/BcnI family restriction endonuclease [Bifidobacterium choerinum]
MTDAEGKPKPDEPKLPWYDLITLDEVLQRFRDVGAHAVWAKYLKKNNNSKNQIYVAPNVNRLSFLPLQEPTYTPANSKKKAFNASKRKRELVRIPLNWTWISEDGEESPAPKAAFSYYPQYPEVRLSGFVASCPSAPNKLFNTEHHGFDEGRILFLGVVGDPGSENAHIAAIATGKNAPASLAVQRLEGFVTGTLFSVPLDTADDVDDADTHSDKPPHTISSASVPRTLLSQIVGYPIIPWRLRGDGTKEEPYFAENAAELTLDAELKVSSNNLPRSVCDAWEFNAYKSNDSSITLFDLDPDFGTLADMGLNAFLGTYGHIEENVANDDTACRVFSREDFAGIGDEYSSKRLELRVFGLEGASYSMSGSIALVDRVMGVIIAGWSFTKLLGQWQKKRDKAVYVPYRTWGDDDSYCVEFDSEALICQRTDFSMVVDALQNGKIDINPRIRIIEDKDGIAEYDSLVRFRTSLTDLGLIYNSVEKDRICE